VVTRAGAAAELGLSHGGVRYLEKTSRLRAIGTDEQGRRTFLAKDVREIAASPEAPRPRVPQRPGQIAARAFELLEAGEDWRDLVKKLEIVPALARELLDQWRGPGDLVLREQHVERLRAHGCTDRSGRIDGATIVAALEGLREANRELRGIAGAGQVKALQVPEHVSSG
jgi:hypothetical protein